jgi:putative copper export protein/methionine-rich copper-binding protein CopC
MPITTIFASIKARALPLLLAVALALLVVRPAVAHASLVRSVPAAGALLDTAPPSITLEFSEALDPAFSHAQLFDSRNQLVEPGPGAVDPVAPRMLRLILPDLPKGSYTAQWRVRSAADGHITQGSLPFGVGVAPTGTALIPPPGAPDPATLPPPPLDTLARWLNLVAAALALGGLPFGLLVWRPLIRAGEPRTKNQEPRTEEPKNRRTEEPRTEEPTAKSREVAPAQQRFKAPGWHAVLRSALNRSALRYRTGEPENRGILDADKRGQTQTISREPENQRTGEPDNQASRIKYQASGTTDNGQRTTDDFMTGFIRRTTALGGVLFVLTNLFFLIKQAAAAANVPLIQAIGLPVLDLLSGRAGLLWLARLALTLQIVVLAWRLPPAGRGPAGLWWALLVVGGVVVLTLSLLSHAAASPAALIAVPLDWLHLAAMIAWLGGLLPLAFAIRAAARTPGDAVPLALLIPRFSRLTIACVAILTLTGIYSYTLQIGALDLLAATSYGRALLIKLGLFGALLLLGGLNLFVLTRRLRLRTADDGRWTMRRRLSSVVRGQKAASIAETLTLDLNVVRVLGRSVGAELLVGALLLLLVGAMTSVAPSKTAWEAHEQQGIAQSAMVGDVSLTLRIAPAQIGDNEFAVDVADARPGAAAAPTRVLLRFDMQGMAMGKLETIAQSAGPSIRRDSAERYTTRGSFTSMGGRWHVEVILRRAGFDDVRHTFEVDIVRGAPFVISQ